MKEKNNKDRYTSSIQCPKCGYEIPVVGTHRRNLILGELRVCSIGPLGPTGKIVLRGNAAFEVEAGIRGWSAFRPVTSDVGVGYVIAKKLCAIMIQLKTATKLADGRYHTTLYPFLEGPFGFIVYYYQNDRTFFLIPSAEFWRIPRFNRLKDQVFAQGEYNDKMSLDTAREVMGDYEGEKGWERLEQLTTPEGLLRTIRVP